MAKKVDTSSVIKTVKQKKPKGRVRLLPLIIVTALISGGIVVERLFLDSLVKTLIVFSLQSEYGAKCDIERVNVDLYNGLFEIEKFALADVANPMKNLFEFSFSSIDFDVTQIFLGRFVADTLSLEGFMLGTTRAVSGEIQNVSKTIVPDDDTSEGVFTREISNKRFDITSNGKNIIEQAVETYNPENMLSSYLEQLQVPGFVEATQVEIEAITTYWQEIVPSIEKSGQELYASVEDVRSLLDSQNVDIETVTEGVQSIQGLVSQSELLQSQINDVFTKLEDDIAAVENMNSSLQAAIKADSALIQDEIAKITSFSFSDAQGMVGSTVESFFIETLGDYYPIVQKGLNILTNVKADAQEAKREEEKKAHERLHGRTVHFNADMPSFLIKNIHFSGSDSGDGVAVAGSVFDVSNNPDLLQKPATAHLGLNLSGFSGVLDAVVDLRTDTENFPVEVLFSGSGLDTKSLTQSDILGVPSIGGDAEIKAEAALELAGDFNVSANFDFNPALLSASQFSPSSVYNMYSSVLESIDSFYVQSTVGFSFEEGMDIGINTNVDTQIVDGLSAALNAEIDALKRSLQGEAEAYLASYTDDFMANVGDFGLASDSILSLQDGLGGLDGELEFIKQELEERIQGKVGDVIQSGIRDSNIGNRLQSLF